MEYNVKLFPNPAIDVLNYNITSDATRQIELKLIDVTGRIVYRKLITVEFGYNDGAIDLSRMRRGVYFIEVNSDSETLREKVLLN
jgi:lysophospholipase L1-like esterase